LNLLLEEFLKLEGLENLLPRFIEALEACFT